MKLLDIALKDLLRSFRSLLGVGMMFVAPLLITGLIYAAFGGVLASSETSEYSLPKIPVQIVNRDNGDPASGFVAGSQLVDAFRSEDVENVFTVTLAADETTARAAVDAGEAAVALLIPADFTQSILLGEQQAVLTLYQDPTLRFGPGIVKEIVDQFTDALAGGQITGTVMSGQFAAQGIVLDSAEMVNAQMEYGNWFASIAGERSWDLPYDRRLPNRAEMASITDHRTALLGPVMGGMLIFFAFFAGCNVAQSILREQEEGTLARMFTTPTPLPVILGGKFLAVFLMLVVQAVALVLASALVFGIRWGSLPALVIVLAGVVVAAAGFGILLMSQAKNTRQAGAMTGGVLTVMAMLGGLFTTGLQGVPPALDTMSLFLPQGWAMRGLKLVLSGARPGDVLLPLLILLAFGVVFFAAGTRSFQKRFA